MLLLMDNASVHRIDDVQMKRVKAHRSPFPANTTSQLQPMGVNPGGDGGGAYINCSPHFSFLKLFPLLNYVLPAICLFFNHKRFVVNCSTQLNHFRYFLTIILLVY